MWLNGSDSLRRLRSHQLFQEKLLPDIPSGQVFPAFRPGKADFYFQGRRLFSFDGRQFRTSIKYAVVVDEEGNEISEENLATLEAVRSFPSAYEGIKRNAKLYQEPESSGVARLWGAASFAHQDSTNDLVVIDIELSLTALDRDGKDRIDIVFFDKRSCTLHFVEAKTFDNPEIRPTSCRTPLVVRQVKAYQAQIQERKDTLLADYAAYVELMNEVFEPSSRLPTPRCIDERVRLLVFGFNAHVESNYVKPLLSTLEEHGICCMSRGSLMNVKSPTLRKWFK